MKRSRDEDPSEPSSKRQQTLPLPPQPMNIDMDNSHPKDPLFLAVGGLTDIPFNKIQKNVQYNIAKEQRYGAAKEAADRFKEQQWQDHLGEQFNYRIEQRFKYPTSTANKQKVVESERERGKHRGRRPSLDLSQSTKSKEDFKKKWRYNEQQKWDDNWDYDNWHTHNYM